MALLRSLAVRHPLVSNMMLYTGLYSCGDLTRQAVQGVKKKDYTSAARLAVVGCFMMGPFNYKWYRMLDQIVKGSGTKVVMKKMLCDQSFAAVIGTCIFFIGTSVVERKQNYLEELKNKGLQTYLTGCVFWPTVQAFNFALLPSHWRATYVGCLAFVWCNIVSYIKSSPTAITMRPPAPPTIHSPAIAQ